MHDLGERTSSNLPTPDVYLNTNLVRELRLRTEITDLHRKLDSANIMKNQQSLTIEKQLGLISLQATVLDDRALEIEELRAANQQSTQHRAQS